MPTRDELLKIHTNKEENFTIGKRIFYSLHKENDKDFSKIHSIKFMGLLVEKLHEKGLLTEEEIDDLLLEAVY